MALPAKEKTLAVFGVILTLSYFVTSLHALNDLNAVLFQRAGALGVACILFYTSAVRSFYAQDYFVHDRISSIEAILLNEIEKGQQVGLEIDGNIGVSQETLKIYNDYLKANLIKAHKDQINVNKENYAWWRNKSSDALMRIWVGELAATLLVCLQTGFGDLFINLISELIDAW